MYRCSYIRVPDYMADYMADHPRFFGLYYGAHTGFPKDAQRDDNSRAWCSVVVLGLAAAPRSICSRRSPTTSDQGLIPPRQHVKPNPSVSPACCVLAYYTSSSSCRYMNSLGPPLPPSSGA